MLINGAGTKWELTCLLLHHLVILLLGEGQSDGVIDFPLPESLVHCQRKQLTVQSTVRLGDTLHAAVVIRGVGNSTVLGIRAPELILQFSIHALTIVLTERRVIWEHSVVILIPGRQNVITGEWGDFAVVLKSSWSPHLPLAWLFQHCSSSDSVSLPLAQMSSGRLDQNLLDSFNFSLMSITCHGPKQSTGIY